MSWRRAWRVAAALRRWPTGAACAAAAGAGAASLSSPAAESTVSAPPAAGTLPTYTRAEVAAHGATAPRVWVTQGDGVYDVTDFVPLHPGGDKILLGAGGSVDAFWAVYQQHRGAHVAELLAKYRIGTLAAADAAAAASAAAAVGDPFAHDPPRSPLLVARSLKPYNGEPPLQVLADHYVTPNNVFFVRNHLPVPDVDTATYALEVAVPGASRPVRLTLADLRARFPRREVVSALQCAGNRRADMGERAARPTRGLSWDAGAIANVSWAGARLRDVLLYAGVRDEEIGHAVRHVHFVGLDADPASGVTYAASIPADTAMDPHGDVLLAYEMNGGPIPRDHGFPLRAIVPGTVGARQVKWLGRIIASPAECDSIWQAKDYKAFAPGTEWDTVDFGAMPAIQDMPVTSAICEPRAGATLPAGARNVTVAGFAWSGGGRAVTRVDVSADGGRTWTTADLEARPPDASPSLTRSWGWTLWRAEVPLPPGATAGAGLVCKAVDSAYNVQPEEPAGIWNYRGVVNNAWHRVDVRIAQPVAGPGPDAGGGAGASP